MDVFGGRPLDLPAELNPIPQAPEIDDVRARTRSAQWRYGLVLGAAVACIGAAAFFVLARRNPAPAPVETPAASAGYLPSVPVTPAVSGPSLDKVGPRTPAPVSAAAPASAAAPVPVSAVASAVVPNPNEIVAHVETQPESARVLRARTGEVLCAATPCDVVHPKLKPGTNMRLRLEAPGFTTQEVFMPVDASGTHAFDLGPRAGGRRPAAAPEGAPAPTPPSAVEATPAAPAAPISAAAPAPPLPSMPF
jgi:hypothetical protein